MSTRFKAFCLITGFLALTTQAIAHQHNGTGHSASSINQSKNELRLEVFKSPTCGCCDDWIAKLEDNNSGVTSYHPEDLAGLKQTLKIRPEYQSCHTGVSKEGFFFEGHVPVYLVKKFLAAPPKGALGLAVPAMPVGSPGMEMGDRFQPYSVLIIKGDGTATIYEEIKTLEQSLRNEVNFKKNADFIYSK
ncbi:MAG: DUF411 domain-containing protein [Cellvibrio sp.]